MPKRKKLTSDDFPNLHANHRERMRSRILRNGAASLEPHELLETLLYLPITRQNTNHTAHMLVEHFGSVEQALRRPANELTQIRGIGEQSAQFLHDMGRVIEAYAQAKRRGRMVLENSADARRLALEFFRENTDAECVLFSLDEAMRLLAASTLPRRPSTQALISAAVKCRASRAVIALRDDGSADHPSHGEADTFIALHTVFSLLNVNFVDFIIVGDGGSRSHLEHERLVACARYVEDDELHESSLHFESGLEATKFADLVSDPSPTQGEPVDETDVSDVDDAFSAADIDPEEFDETVVEPLGTVAQMSGSEADTPLGASAFGDLFDGEEADEEPF